MAAPRNNEAACGHLSKVTQVLYGFTKRGDLRRWNVPGCCPSDSFTFCHNGPVRVRKVKTVRSSRGNWKINLELELAAESAFHSALASLLRQSPLLFVRNHASASPVPTSVLLGLPNIRPSQPNTSPRQ